MSRFIRSVLRLLRWIAASTSSIKSSCDSNSFWSVMPRFFRRLRPPDICSRFELICSSRVVGAFVFFVRADKWSDPLVVLLLHGFIFIFSFIFLKHLPKCRRCLRWCCRWWRRRCWRTFHRVIRLLLCFFIFDFWAEPLLMHLPPEWLDWFHVA